MKKLVLVVSVAVVLPLVAFWGSTSLVNLTTSYLGEKVRAMSTADGMVPSMSLAWLMLLCSIGAGILYGLYVKWYRNSSLLVYIGMLASAILLACAGVAWNVSQLHSALKSYKFPTHNVLNRGSLTYFDWGAWPVIVAAVVTLAILFILQPADPDDLDDSVESVDET